MNKYSIGLDFGTNSVRALIVDVESGEEVGTAVIDYASGDHGVLIDSKDPHLARQHPGDYIEGLEKSIHQALESSPLISPQDIVGIGVDTTGSTPMPVDENCVPLALLEEWRDNLSAQAWLWKDHTSIEEANEITEKAKEEPYLAKCGGAYSSEWFWAKMLKCERTDPRVLQAADTWMELCDYIPAYLTGARTPKEAKRSACAAGHKAMYHSSWNGLPSKAFLSKLSPTLASMRDNLYERVYSADKRAGTLSIEIANKLNLKPGTPVSVGAFDAHLGAVGSGIERGMLVKIMGTSTCDIMVAPNDGTIPDIPGLCGIAEESVLPNMLGLEAGQSAVGDLFNWGATKLADGDHERLQAEASKLKPGETGLLALDWNNGNRTILVDQALTGLIVGQTLHTNAAEIYRALVEATAFGALRIIERLEEYGVPIERIVCCGGIADKSAFVMQIYADILNRPIHISKSGQTCALGAAICGAVAGGAHKDVASAQKSMTAFKETVYKPNSEANETYLRLYALYRNLHDAFGVRGTQIDLSGLMKELISIRKSVINA
jgi:L-ribulokinase